MKLFNQKLTRWESQVTNWQEAIQLGVNILIENGYATHGLYNAILDSTTQFGAYYVLEPGIALVHAPAGDYALKPGVSLVVLDQNITFNNQADKQARLIFTLSAPNNVDHIELIQQFGTYFTNPTFKTAILNVKNSDELWKIIAEYKES
ncbi:PTS sugar transporter subunit IIA [Candidatus Mycoplasma pogonae]